MAQSLKHSGEYIQRREQQLAYMESLTEGERALVYEYGFDRAVLAMRQFGGRAAHILEEERKALQLSRLRSKT